MLLLKVVFFSIVYHSTSSSTSLFHPLYFITLSPSSPIQFIILFCHHCHDLLATQTRSLSPRSEVFYRAGTSPIWLASIRHFDVWWQLLFDSSPNQQTHHTDSQTGFFLQGTTLVTGSSFLPWHVWAETVTQSSSQKGVPAPFSCSFKFPFSISARPDKHHYDFCGSHKSTTCCVPPWRMRLTLSNLLPRLAPFI